MMQELNYIRCGDYFIPDIRLSKENRPIGRWGRIHRDYIKEHNPIRFNDLANRYFLMLRISEVFLLKHWNTNSMWLLSSFINLDFTSSAG